MSFEIRGVDISNNNPNADLQSLAENDVKYVYIKVGEGTTFKDAYRERHYNEAKANGMKVGAYHYLKPTSAPETQAQAFVSLLAEREWDLIPMVDVEDPNFPQVADYLIRFINEFRRLSSMNLGIYTYTSYIPNIESVKDLISDMPLWIADYQKYYSGVPSNFFSNTVGWQDSENGVIGNFRGDTDWFNTGCLLEEIPKGTWIVNNDGWWFRYEDGTYPQDTWAKLPTSNNSSKLNWYKFDDRGYMEYGWMYSSGNWYYAGDSQDGAMKTGWLKKDGAWFYLKDTGERATGWQKVNNEWYFMNNDGVMQTGWIQDKGNWYLLDSNGAMYSDCTAYGYTFNSDGVATKID